MSQHPFNPMPRCWPKCWRKQPILALSLASVMFGMTACAGGGGGNDDSTAGDANVATNDTGSPLPSQAMTSGEAFTQYVMGMLSLNENGPPMSMPSDAQPPGNDSVEPMAVP